MGTLSHHGKDNTLSKLFAEVSIVFNRLMDTYTGIIGVIKEDIHRLSPEYLGIET